MARRRRSPAVLDIELTDLPPALRWREWMARVETVLFAAPGPVDREVLTRIVGRDCSIDLIIDDIRTALRERPYELVSVAGGWQLRTRRRHAEAIQAAFGAAPAEARLTPAEILVLAVIAYHQPVTRGEIGEMIGKAVSRDLIGDLRGLGFIAAGPQSPRPGAPYTYVTTKRFLEHFGLDTLRDLPDLEALEEAGLLDKDKLLAREFTPTRSIEGDPEHDRALGPPAEDEEPWP